MMRRPTTNPAVSLLAGGMLGLLNAAWKDRLTVLAYHRVAECDPAQFDTYRPVVSATPAAFERQMEFVRARFSVVAARDVLAWQQERRPLPPAPLLITFDDGYRDNFEQAFPILRQKGLTATFFVTTDFVDDPVPLYWDLVAYCLCHTPRQEAALPLVGRQCWESREDRDRVARSFLKAVKRRPDAERRLLVSQLPHLLDVPVATTAFERLSMTWDQVRLLARAGFEIGAHTQSHPILTRMPLAAAESEIAHSKLRLESETGQPVRLFAYPSGMAGDFNEEVKHVVERCGFRLAFSLLPGPQSLSAVLAEPFAVRRTLVSGKDTLPRLAAKLMGAARLAEKSR